MRWGALLMRSHPTIDGGALGHLVLQPRSPSGYRRQAIGLYIVLAPTASVRTWPVLERSRSDSAHNVT